MASFNQTIRWVLYSLLGRALQSTRGAVQSATVRDKGATSSRLFLLCAVISQRPFEKNQFKGSVWLIPYNVRFASNSDASIGPAPLVPWKPNEIKQWVHPSKRKISSARSLWRDYGLR
ncbi:hypothetical protein NPIL_515211 [Nephila pilipes]|uniref:Uncharacterized protein n=1 Tax=Nephila pilipes TaxID=299642 RepID=A0A8X6QJS3_NEPPI|nr:hypothetical protein NPIL_515211 [Nephila pilipes]